MNSLILRAVTDADVEALARLGRESFVDKFGYLYRPEDLASYLAQAHTAAAIAAEVANPTRLYRVAELQGQLVGYCKLGLACGFPEFARGNNVIELKQLYTAPGMTGAGIGARLMEWALATAASQRADEMQLSVWSGNEGAQRFYARYGFAKVADVTFRVGEQLDHEFLFARML